jgi:hypothetical protein
MEDVMIDVTGVAIIPRPIVPGEEMEALKTFHLDGTWTGSKRDGIPTSN